MITLIPYLMAIENEKDRSFIAALYEAYSKTMKLYALSLVGERFAEDVLHNAFQKLINNIETLKDLCPEKRRAYIYATIRTCAYDIVRKEQKYTDIDEYEQILSEDIPTVVDKIIDQEGYEYLKSCIRSLSDTYREVCEMKYILHMKEREIAQELGLSEKNVNARIFRGKQVLRKMIQESYGYDK
ncbi:MAG: sigma-70 family RNA polymerase sigma factor [Clostridia bacterium]|nr:sigma-70 family RNA polymerase sigma factor [Clostridia bacterium]